MFKHQNIIIRNNIIAIYFNYITVLNTKCTVISTTGKAVIAEANCNCNKRKETKRAVNMIKKMFQVNILTPWKRFLFSAWRGQE